jgi:hypothetical protein
MWASAIIAASLTAAAALNRHWFFGVRTSSGLFVHWVIDDVAVGVGPTNRPTGVIVEPRRRSGRTPQTLIDMVHSWRNRQHFAIPTWLPPLPPLTLCALSYYLSRPNTRGRCTNCGYNLAGLPPTAAGTVLCPECGNAA